ncbi:protein of unknown function [Nocardia amikacinitolerans]|uniref:DUF4333 domain-containing protein n=1 Tax=Nocardia amikacinitolerans TaxID=756689 RepID=A0A285L2W4_9NOCA|nr:DUF4333 domain-containing protein [Nocardia amikacinitolerans]MCP2277993.1 protein of unknown function (DUF4333) [Nocardia amikacinitolerans]MCP2296568.1 protein of unknown function (DUF4333) [Nocardia amikacinitolerans]MCP2321129.1 protein of unknown function (DUF4333) [Nocardia amikacinitolerans]SNY79270.1 protein of unknown function [Nocardia amikacinitolerans]
MTAPTRPPRASQPYPVAEHPDTGEFTDSGWLPVLVAALVGAVAIAIAGVIAGLVVVNIRESAVADNPVRTPAASAPMAQSPAPVAPVRAVEPAPQLLDQVDLQRGVQLVLIDSYGMDDVRDVRCPSGQTVTVDATFDCLVKVGSTQKSVSVTITDTDGTYEVGRPY